MIKTLYFADATSHKIMLLNYKKLTKLANHGFTESAKASIVNSSSESNNSSVNNDVKIVKALLRRPKIELLAKELNLINGTEALTNIKAM